MKQRLIKPTLLILLLVIGNLAYGQSETDLYIYDLKLINPAFIASDNDFEITGLYSQFPIISNNNLQRFQLTHSNRIGATNSAIGSVLWYETSDYSHWLKLRTGYNYKFNLKDNSSISAGAYLKYSNFQIDDNWYQHLIDIDPNTPLYVDQSQESLDLDLGVAYINGNTTVGLNIANVWAPENQNPWFSVRERRHYNIFAGQRIKVNNWLNFDPSVSLLLNSNLEYTQFDVNGIFTFNNLILFGVNYEIRNGISNDLNASVGVRIKDRVDLIVRGFTLLRNSSSQTSTKLDIEVMAKIRLGKKK